MLYQDYLTALKNKATQIRMNSIRMITDAGSGHTGSTLSCVDILVALFYGQGQSGPYLNIDPVRPRIDTQDYFVLSKGQAAPALYSILADLGFFDIEELNHYKKSGALLTAIPNNRIPGIILSSGHLGQGLQSAIGLALALKNERSRNQVFVLIGDAEFGVGQVQEALLLAGHYKLGNLTVIVDKNVIQFDDLVRNVNVGEPFSEKFDSMGFRSINVFAGHDYDHLADAFEKVANESRLPKALICKTVKGKGVDFVENKGYYHDSPLSEIELKEALKGLERKIIVSK